MPVAETRAEFLFTDLAPADAGSTWSSSASQPDRAPLPPASDEVPRDGFACLPGGVASTGAPLVTSVVPAGAVPTPAIRITEGGLISYLSSERGCRYEQPFPPGMFRPPRAAC